jgi:hypothetical protein
MPAGPGVPRVTGVDGEATTALAGEATPRTGLVLPHGRILARVSARPAAATVGCQHQELPAMPSQELAVDPSDTAGNGNYYRQHRVWFYTRTHRRVPGAWDDGHGLVAPEVTAFRLLDYFGGAAYLGVAVSVIRTYAARRGQYDFPPEVWRIQGRNGTPLWAEPILGQWRKQHPARQQARVQDVAVDLGDLPARRRADTAGNGNYYRVGDAWFYSIDHSPVPGVGQDRRGMFAPELVAWRLLDIVGVAELLCRAPATVRSEAGMGYLPPPVARFGRRSPVWSQPIIERYLELRPGPGRWRRAPRFAFEGRSARELQQHGAEGGRR